MKAAILKKPRVLTVEDIPKPEYNDNEILIRIKEVGICGSDVHYYNEGRIGDFIVKEPIVLGHESSGIVEEIGKNVKGLEIGDRVAIEPGIPCKSCNYCKEGKYHLCPNIRFLATPPYNGAFVEYLTYDPDFVFKLPEELSFTSGAMIEPLSVAYNACMRANILPGQTLLIMGAGPIGLSILEVSKTFGASKIYITDIDDYRLKVAAENGAYQSINVKKKDILRELEDEKIDVVIEASGAESSIVKSIKLAKNGGKVVWVGMGRDEIKIPYSEVTSKDLTLKGIFRYKNTYPPVINLLTQKKIKIDYIISHRFSIDDIQEAFELLNNKNVNKLKVIVNI